jgi:site-specific recombinase XerD
MLRHAAATALVDEGLPLTDVSALLGHASLATTQRYVAVRKDRAAAAARRAARRLGGGTARDAA